MKAICSPDCLDIVGITANRTRSKVGKLAEVVMGKARYKPGNNYEETLAMKDDRVRIGFTYQTQDWWMVS